MAYSPTKIEPPADLLPEVRREIEAGLYERTRADLAAYDQQLDYLEMRNFVHLERRPSETEADFRDRPKRFCYVTRKAIRTLARLYTPGPARKFEGTSEDGETPATSAAASFLIDVVYERQHINALLQKVDQLATLHGVCAVQPVPTGKEDDPVRLDVWGRNEFVPYFTDDDYRNPAAIVTKSLEYRGKKARTVYRLWTDKRVDTFATDWFEHDPRAGGVVTRAARHVPADSGDHPYGVVPFAFFHNSLPVDKFDGSGIGGALAHANGEADADLSDEAQIVQTFLSPKLFGINLSEAFRWKDRVDGVTVLPWAVSPDDGAPAPDVFFRQPTLDVEQAWLHVEKYLNQTFEDLDVPVKAVRGESHWEASGIAIVVGMAPLLQYLRDRQAPFGVYEQRLADLVLIVAGSWYDAPELTAFAGTPLELQWPPVAIPIPSQEVDAGYEAGLRMGTESPVTVVMKKDGLTREQAEGHLAQVAEDNERFSPQPQEATDGQEQDQGQGRQEGRQVLTAADANDESDANE